MLGNVPAQGFFAYLESAGAGGYGLPVINTGVRLAAAALLVVTVREHFIKVEEPKLESD